MFRKFSPWIAFLMLFVNNTSMALGLGEIKLKSSLNQPLNAEIRLLSAESLVKSQIIVNLASREEFDKVGVEHYFFLKQIKFVTVFKEDGSVLIKATTKKAVKEPFLDFLIEVNWPNGRMIREYTVLLDPPSFTEVVMTSAPETAISTSNNDYQPQNVDTNTIPADRWSDGTDESSTSDDYADGSGTNIGDDDYRVKNADTLWGIARRNRLQNTSIQQSMVAIFNANPDAFVNENMNQLKRGAVLKISDATAQLTQQQALLEIARQNQLWGGRGNSGTRPDAVLDTADYASTASSGDPSEPRLKLAAAGEGDTGGASSALESEAVTTLNEENQSLRNRLEGQSERIEKLERLLELKNSELASISDNAATNNDTNTTSEDPFVTPDLAVDSETILDSPAIDMVDAETTIDDSATQLPGTEADTDNTETITQPEIANSEQQKAAEPAKIDNAIDSVNIAPVALKKDRSWIDEILNLGTMVWLAIGSGVLILFFSFLWIRRKNMTEEEFQDSLVIGVSEELEDDNLEVADDILASEMGVDHDYIPEAEAEQFNEDTVDMETNADPLGEADVYLAYGKFDQAERILRDALEEEPDRLDLRLKIMECFAETKSLSEFKDQKREILEVLATDDAVAEQVNIMERQAWPEESEDQDDLPSTEDIFGDLSFGSENEDELSFPEDEADDLITTAADDNDLDSALDITTANEDDKQTATEGQSEDEFIDAEIDLETDGDLDFNAASDDVTEEVETEVEEGVDFISESDLMDAEIDDDIAEELEDEPIDESILDLGDVDEASTKLDLARAYIDMEDFDGASEILQEVLTEGSDAQKAEAEELLDRMK